MLLFLNLHVVVWAVSAFVCCCFLIRTLLSGLCLRFAYFCFLTRCCFGCYGLRQSVVVSSYVAGWFGCSCVCVLLLINTLLSLAVPASEF